MRRTGLGCQLLLATIVLSSSTGMTEALSASSGSEVFDALADSVVLLLAEHGGGDVSQGTGFVVTEDGVVATALHVIDGATNIAVKLRSGELFDVAYVVNFDKRKDLALVKLLAVDLTPVPLADFSTVRTGDSVIAITNPKGLEHAYAEGSVSAVRLDDSMGAKVVQTTVPLSSGSSDGPLLNSAGEAIGLVSFKLVDGESLNFGIPISYVAGLLQLDRQLSLATFNEQVRQADTRNVADFDDQVRGSLEGQWKSITTGDRFVAREAGGALYLELVPGAGGDGSSSVTTAKLTAIDGGWAGELTMEFTCDYVSGRGTPWQKTHKKLCSFEMQVELPSVAPTEMTGRVKWLPSGVETTPKDCKNCYEDIPLEWREFVLVRPD